MQLVSPRKASRFFKRKLDFTTGPIELNGMIEGNEDITIVDVRAAEDYLAGHIPGAINLPGHGERIYEGLSREKVNIIYCYSEVCHLAAESALDFAEHGFPVMELEGGWEQWQHYNLPVES